MDILRETFWLTNIDYKYIQRIEGKNPPAIKIDTIERLANALKIKLSSYLIFNIEMGLQ